VFKIDVEVGVVLVVEVRVVVEVVGEFEVDVGVEFVV